ncbi:MAG: hypothetical protein INR70_25715 [Parafilimonas terrae]|nr:hypothetical protein [Parafilimonas terrae]
MRERFNQTGRNNRRNPRDTELSHKLSLGQPSSERLDEGAAMAKPITLKNRLVDAVVTAAIGFSLIVHAQFMILPPHFV